MSRLAFLGALAAVAALAAAPGAASGQNSTAVFVGEGHPLSAYQSDVKARGEVVVDFHGDAAAGCAEAHLCDVSGTITWSPGSRGSLLVIGYRDGGRHMEQGYLGVGDELGEGNAQGTSARVRRAGPAGAEGGLCADVGASFASSEAAPHEGSSIDLSLFGSSEVLRTRCAGPLTSDVSSLLPTRSIDEAAIKRGGAKLDYSADGEFAAHGLAGTLHSNVVLTVKKGNDLLADQGGNETTNGGKTKRTRYLEVSYRVESVSGEVAASVHGLSDPDLCGPLDACGLLGTVTARPKASKGDGFAIAFAPAKRSRRELRQALGVVPGPVPRGVHRVAFFEWQDKGSVTSDLSRDGAPACSDSAPLAGGGLLDLRFSGRHATAHYYSGVGEGDALRTRCPGPGGGDAVTGLARGRVPLRKVGGRHATLRLTRGTAFSSSGYRSATTSSLTVTIRRTRIHERVERDPTGP